ncbi:putative feruloyl esterase B-2 [Termitomyces sp. T112]|nr:putative feruloyl esterase B-2 [Termitomyces sp. T112]
MLSPSIRFYWHTLFALLALPRITSAQNDPSSCTDLANLHLENTTILSSTYISGTANVTTPGSCQSQALVSNSLCRVQFIINTTSTSTVHAEAWLPDTWYGRYLGLGNGGLNGCIDYTNLDYGTSLHFATIASDGGHDGNTGLPFLNNPEVISDFSFRALHASTLIGKQLVEEFYGRPHDTAYYLGCSTGGRQGMQAALKFPEDFDGIVAGAPAVNTNFLEGWAAMLGKLVGAPDPTGTPGFIPPELWDSVAEEVLRQCDALDGVEDGIITEPDECVFRPEALICEDGDEGGCLTKEQVEVVRSVYQPMYGGSGMGELLSPRFDPGAEADGGAQRWLSGSFDPLIVDWYRFAILNDSTYDFENFSMDTVMLGASINPGDIETFSGNLSAFKARGGKFLTYHGRRDQLIPSGSSKCTYDLISRTLALSRSSMDTFYRLFLVPGMNHCIGGPGSMLFGQMGAVSNALNNSDSNVLLAMVKWVEGDVGPDVVRGIGFGSAGEVIMRSHCRYPMRSMWDEGKREFECVV